MSQKFYARVDGLVMHKVKRKGRILWAGMVEIPYPVGSGNHRWGICQHHWTEDATGHHPCGPVLDALCPSSPKQNMHHVHKNSNGGTSLWHVQKVFFFSQRFSLLWWDELCLDCTAARWHCTTCKGGVSAPSSHGQYPFFYGLNRLRLRWPSWNTVFMRWLGLDEETLDAVSCRSCTSTPLMHAEWRPAPCCNVTVFASCCCCFNRGGLDLNVELPNFLQSTFLPSLHSWTSQEATPSCPQTPVSCSETYQGGKKIFRWFWWRWQGKPSQKVSCQRDPAEVPDHHQFLGLHGNHALV